LGPVGARIVAEVFVGLVAGDHKSYLHRMGTDRGVLQWSTCYDSLVTLVPLMASGRCSAGQ
jgi:hypothetical protein